MIEQAEPSEPNKKKSAHKVKDKSFTTAPTLVRHLKTESTERQRSHDPQTFKQMLRHNTNERSWEHPNQQLIIHRSKRRNTSLNQNVPPTKILTLWQDRHKTLRWWTKTIRNVALQHQHARPTNWSKTCNSQSNKQKHSISFVVGIQYMESIKHVFTQYLKQTNSDTPKQNKHKITGIAPSYE